MHQSARGAGRARPAHHQLSGERRPGAAHRLDARSGDRRRSDRGGGLSLRRCGGGAGLRSTRGSSTRSRVGGGSRATRRRGRAPPSRSTTARSLSSSTPRSAIRRCPRSAWRFWARPEPPCSTTSASSRLFRGGKRVMTKGTRDKGHDAGARGVRRRLPHGRATLAGRGHGCRDARDLRDPRRHRLGLIRHVNVTIVSQYFAPESGRHAEPSRRVRGWARRARPQRDRAVRAAVPPSRRFPARLRQAAGLRAARAAVHGASPVGGGVTQEDHSTDGWPSTARSPAARRQRSQSAGGRTSCSPPRLPCLACWASLRWPARGASPLVVDVRDIWPAAAEALGELSNPRIIAFFGRAERAAVPQAPIGHRDDAAVLPPHRRGRRPRRQRPPPQRRARRARRTRRRRAAVPLGVPRRLRRQPGHRAGAGDRARRRGPARDQPVRFVLVGDGPVKARCSRKRGTGGLGSVVFRPGVPVSEVGAFLQSCDALLVPLRDHPLLGDFIPSKLYDAMAVGRPATRGATRRSG